MGSTGHFPQADNSADLILPIVLNVNSITPDVQSALSLSCAILRKLGCSMIAWQICLINLFHRSLKPLGSVNFAVKPSPIWCEAAHTSGESKTGAIHSIGSNFLAFIPRITYEICLAEQWTPPELVILPSCSFVIRKRPLAPHFKSISQPICHICQREKVGTSVPNNPHDQTQILAGVKGPHRACF